MRRVDVDVAVVGGGPAGLSTAQTAARAGLEVVVLERGGGIGEPVRTSGASFIRPLRRLGLPASCWWPVRKVRLVGPHAEVVKRFRRPVGCILDVRGTYQWLAAQAVEAGAQVWLRARVTDPIVEGGRVVGVRVHDALAGEVELRARVVVDAAGHTGPIARAAGLRPATTRSAVGIELELHAPDYDQDVAVLAVGDAIARHGYAWVFPCGAARVRLGVGVLRPDSAAELRELQNRLTDVLPTLTAGLDRGRAIELHQGVMPVLPPDDVRLVGDGLLVVGDAAGQGSTLLGEGIRYAILAGQLAGRTLAAAGGDFSAAGLADYPREWRRRMGRDLAIAYAIHQRVRRYSDPDWDRIIRHLQHVPAGLAGQFIAGHFTVPWGLRVLAARPALARSVVRAARSAG